MCQRLRSVKSLPNSVENCPERKFSRVLLARGLATKRADVLGGLNRFHAGLAGMKRAPSLVVGINHLAGNRCDSDQNDPCIGMGIQFSGSLWKAAQVAAVPTTIRSDFALLMPT